MRKLLKRKKGIVLLSAMLMLMVITMLAVVLVSSGMNTLALGSNYNNRELAFRAAESGAAFIQAMLNYDAQWMAVPSSTAQEEAANRAYFQSAGDGQPSSAFSLQCDYHNQTVVGTFYKEDGETVESKFRIAFLPAKNSSSYATPTSAPDFSVMEPRTKGQTVMPFYSCLNLQGASTASSYKCKQEEDAPGVQVTAFRDVLPRSAHIVVQGICGTSVVYYEQMLGLDSSIEGFDGSVAQENIDINLMNNDSVFLVNNKDKSVFGASALRSLTNVNVNALERKYNESDYDNLYVVGSGENDADDFQYGKVYSSGVTVNGGNAASGKYAFNYDGTKNSETRKNLEKINNSVEKPDFLSASGGSSTNNRLYIFTPEERKIRLYESANVLDIHNMLENGVSLDGTSASGASFTEVSTVEGLPVKFGDEDGKVQIQLEGDHTLKGNVYMAAFECADGFDENRSLPVSGDYIFSSNYGVNMAFSEDQGEIPQLVMEDGSLHLEGSVSGTGKIYARSGVSFQGRSFFDTIPDSGVAIYTEEGDIQILPATGVKDLDDKLREDLTGAWGNLKAKDYKKTEDIAKDFLNSKVNATGKPLYQHLADTYGMTEENVNHLADLVSKKNAYMENGNNQQGKYQINRVFDAENGLEYLVFSETDSTAEMFRMKLQDGSTSEYKLLVLDPTGAGPVADDMAGYAKVGTLKLNLDQKGSGKYKDSTLRLEKKVIDKNGTHVLKNKTRELFGKEEKVEFELKSWDGTLWLSSDRLKNTVFRGFTYTTDGNFTHRPEYQGNKSNIKKDLGKYKLQSADNLILPNANDTLIKGLMFTRSGDFVADLDGGTLSIFGGVVANGRIDITNARFINFNYDPSYMQIINSGGVGTKAVFQSVFTAF